jgi:uncharacterized protein
MFQGRQAELNSLNQLVKKQSASLVIVKGRRRVGKSRLISEFAKTHPFIRIAGLPPTKETTAQSQRDRFASIMCAQLKLPAITATSWDTLFQLLAEKTASGRHIILFDEISWMGSKDADFLGQLKNAWDHEFSANPELILVLCGSVSTWITEEIINSTAFLGRPSLYLTLTELSLPEAAEFWHNHSGAIIAPQEILKTLSVTGGIPRYLELINPALPSEKNIKDILFKPQAPLIDEFDRIFNDIFGKSSKTYKSIISCLTHGAKTQMEILEETKRSKSGDISTYLNNLAEAGFIQKETTFNIRSRKLSNKSKYRLKDNFLRFYLRCVEPNLIKIREGLLEHTSLNSTPGWHSILGLQFENLILNNIKLVLIKLNISFNDIVFFGPHFQQKTKSKKGCQIDLLIQTRTNILYICEIKFHSHRINLEIIETMKEKIARLDTPKQYSCIPVLIHANGITDELDDTKYFPYLINVSDLLS